jgi:diketogulonate reductase-like aldo/keto reductase
MIPDGLYPHHATRRGIEAACARSLKNLGTDWLDLYLLHWRGGVALAETVAGFEALRRKGMIRRWGVSNLDLADLHELGPALADCAANQVLWNLEHRGVEFDLLPFCVARGLPVMAYSPLGQGGALLRHAMLRTIARRHGVEPAAVALAFVLARPGMIAIPKAGSLAHLAANHRALSVTLAAEDLAELDRAFPPPMRKRALAMI